MSLTLINTKDNKERRIFYVNVDDMSIKNAQKYIKKLIKEYKKKHI